MARSPELGQAKRWAKNAEDLARQKYSHLIIIEGTIWTKDNKEAARLSHRMKNREMRIGWKSLEVDWTEFQTATTPRQ